MTDSRHINLTFGGAVTIAIPLAALAAHFLPLPVAPNAPGPIVFMFILALGMMQALLMASLMGLIFSGGIAIKSDRGIWKLSGLASLILGGIFIFVHPIAALFTAAPLAFFVFSCLRSYLTTPTKAEQQKEWEGWQKAVDGLGQNPFEYVPCSGLEEILKLAEEAGVTEISDHGHHFLRSKDENGRQAGIYVGKLFAGPPNYAFKQMRKEEYFRAHVTELISWLKTNREAVEKIGVAASDHEQLPTGFRGLFSELPGVVKIGDDGVLLGGASIDSPFDQTCYLGVKRI